MSIQPPLSPASHVEPLNSAGPSPPSWRHPSADHSLDSFPIFLLLLLHFLMPVFFIGYIWLNWMHGKMPRNRPDDPSAGKAIGFLFIPFFNGVWIFISGLRLMHRIDEQRALRGMQPAAPHGLTITLCVLTVLSAIPFFGILPVLAVYFVVLPLVLSYTQSAVNGLVHLTSDESGSAPSPEAIALADNRAWAGFRSGWAWCLVLGCLGGIALIGSMYLVTVFHPREDLSPAVWIFTCVGALVSLPCYFTAMGLFLGAVHARRRIAEIQRVSRDAANSGAPVVMPGYGLCSAVLSAGAVMLLLLVVVQGWNVFAPPEPIVADAGIVDAGEVIAGQDVAPEAPPGAAQDTDPADAADPDRTTKPQGIRAIAQRRIERARREHGAPPKRPMPPAAETPPSGEAVDPPPSVPVAPEPAKVEPPQPEKDDLEDDLPVEKYPPPPESIPPQEGERYLRELKPKQVATHFFLKLDRNFTLAEKDYEHGLTLCLIFRGRPSHVAYEFDKPYIRLRGAAGVPDNRIHGCKSPMTLRILADGAEVWKSERMQHSGHWAPFDIDLTGVHELQFSVEAEGNVDGGHAVLLDPVLVGAERS